MEFIVGTRPYAISWNLLHSQNFRNKMNIIIMNHCIYVHIQRAHHRTIISHMHRRKTYHIRSNGLLTISTFVDQTQIQHYLLFAKIREGEGRWELMVFGRLKWNAHAQPKMRCACTAQNDMRMRNPKKRCACALKNDMRICIVFGVAHAHLILGCACAPHFWTAHTHLIFGCTCASHYGLRMRISFWTAQTHLIFGCACASHFALRMRISLWAAHAHLILVWARFYHF